MIIPALVIWQVIRNIILSILFRFLFTRSAGEQAPVTAQLASLPDELGNKTAEIILNGQSLGTIQNFSEEGNAKLSEKQTTEITHGAKRKRKY